MVNPATNPFRSGLRTERVGDPCAVVIFGASGDLSHRKLFTGAGFWYFLKGNLATFWCGEQLWHRLPLANETVNLALVGLTLGVISLVVLAWLVRRTGFSAPQRVALSFAILTCLATLAFFALLSIKYDFRDCFYPSRVHPFFVSGRLMLGVLVPFMVLFAAGLERLTRNFQANSKYLLLVFFLVFLAASEATTNWVVFPNVYNWFHN